ncbi:MAG: hypothetical protein KC496_23140 [Anaerolineae bacterium]|nr:hypothetical protein [Anaerolineae bacterium]
MDSNLQDQLNEYVTNLFAQEDVILQAAQQNARENGLRAMHIKPFEGRLLQFLA